jgi:serine protease Do
LKSFSALPSSFLRVLALCLFVASVVRAAPESTPREVASPDVVQNVVNKVKPSLVRIQVVSSTPVGGRETKAESFGSGVIISPDGFVVTNHHVAGNARWISCTLSSREQVEAKLIGTDPLSDISVIKLDAEGAPYPTARWGNSDTLRVGDAVLAMGSPLALSQSVTAGIVSNTELVMPDTGEQFTLEGEDVGSIVRWIGHDAAIHPGNSGGPLVNLSGEIIGINEIELGLSGAIPGNLAREVASQLIEKGRVLRAYIGLELQPRLRQDTRTTGALVSGVLPASPAAFAGIKAGDLLIKAGDQPIDAKFSEQLPLINRLLAHLPIGEEVELQLEREGKPLTISVKPAQRDQATSRSLEIKGWGITGSDITPFMAREYALPAASGVLITGVQTGGPAGEAEPALQQYDIVAKVGDKPVKNLAQLNAISANIPATKDGTPTLVEVLRSGERILTVVAIHKAAAEDTSVEVAKPFFPASTQVVTPPLATALKLPAGTQGVRITQIFPNSAAVNAGLQIGDVLLKVDGAPIEATAAEDDDIFPAMIRQYKIGTLAKLLVLRRNEKGAWARMQKTIKLPQAPKSQRELQTYRDENFGMTLRSITYMDRIKGSAAPTESGVMITAVEEGSWAALAGLEAGHVIRSIDGVNVNTMEAARAKLKSLEATRPKWTTFFVSGGLHTGFVEIQTDWSLPTSPKANGVSSKS